MRSSAAWSRRAPRWRRRPGSHNHRRSSLDQRLKGAPVPDGARQEVLPRRLETVTQTDATADNPVETFPNPTAASVRITSRLKTSQSAPILPCTSFTLSTSSTPRNGGSSMTVCASCSATPPPRMKWVSATVVRVPKVAATSKDYLENDTASAIPRPREYAGRMLSFVLPSDDASNLMCGFELAASIAHPSSAPIPVQTAAAPT